LGIRRADDGRFGPNDKPMDYGPGMQPLYVCSDFGQMSAAQHTAYLKGGFSATQKRVHSGLVAAQYDLRLLIFQRLIQEIYTIA
jgi:hypothetical protein